MRSATARVASRRGSSMMMRLPRAHGSSSSASGTTVLLPAPGGATTTALPPARSASASGATASSIGRPERIGCGGRAPLALGARAARELEQRARALDDGHVDDPAVERRRGAALPLGFLERGDDALGVRDLLRRRREALVQRVDLLGMNRELALEPDALRLQRVVAETVEVAQLEIRRIEREDVRCARGHAERLARVRDLRLVLEPLDTEIVREVLATERDGDDALARAANLRDVDDCLGRLDPRDHMERAQT